MNTAVEYDHVEHLIATAMAEKGIKPVVERKQPVNWDKQNRKRKLRECLKARAAEEAENAAVDRLTESNSRFQASFRPNFVSSAAHRR